GDEDVKPLRLAEHALRQRLRREGEVLPHPLVFGQLGHEREHGSEILPLRVANDHQRSRNCSSSSFTRSGASVWTKCPALAMRSTRRFGTHSSKRSVVSRTNTGSRSPQISITGMSIGRITSRSARRW